MKTLKIKLAVFSVSIAALVAALLFGGSLIPAFAQRSAFLPSFELVDDLAQSTATPQPEEIEFVGTVEAITPAAWTVSGQTVQVTAQTELQSGLAVGDLVKVHASVDAAGMLTAREIKISTAGPGVNGNDDNGNMNGNDNGNTNGNDNGSINGNANDDDDNGNINDNGNANDDDDNGNVNDNGNANDDDDNGNGNMNGNANDDHGNDNGSGHHGGNDNGNDNGRHGGNDD